MHGDLLGRLQGLNMGIGLGLNLLLQGLMAAVRDPILFGTVVCRHADRQHLDPGLAGDRSGTGVTSRSLAPSRSRLTRFSRAGRFVLTTILASIIFIVILAAPILIAAVVDRHGHGRDGRAVSRRDHLVSDREYAGRVFVIYVSTRLLMYYYLIIDRNAGVIDSLQQSWILCQNRVGTIILVIFVQFAIVLAGFLALCVGLIFAAPLATMLYPVTYLALTGTRTAQPGKPEFIWEDDV